MANVFNNYLGHTPGTPTVRDYQHAARLFVDNTYNLAPKNGWIFYVSFEINKAALGTAVAGASLGTSLLNVAQGLSGQSGIADIWQTTSPNIGMLVKSTDLPKFTIQTETMNQYNRKTVIQKGITYNPVVITFHDDMDNVTQKIWTYYYQYYYADSNSTVPLAGAIGGAIGGQLLGGIAGAGIGSVVGGALGNIIGGGATLPAAKYGNTKYNPQSVITPSTAYGLNSNQVDPFFNSITIFQLNQKEYSAFTLVNPLITEWTHDRLDVSAGNKVLENKMTVAYETVTYSYGTVSKGTPKGFASVYYDMTPSPISTVGNGSHGNTSDVFGGLGNSGDSTQGGMGVLGSLLGTQGLVSDALGALTGQSGAAGALGGLFGGSAIGSAVGGIGAKLFGGGSGSAGPTASAVATGTAAGTAATRSLTGATTETPGVVTNPDGSTTQTLDDGSTVTTNADGTTTATPSPTDTGAIGTESSNTGDQSSEDTVDGTDPGSDSDDSVEEQNDDSDEESGT